MGDAVLGLDLSMSCTGAVILQDGWLDDAGAIDWGRVAWCEVTFPAAPEMERMDQFEVLCRRLVRLATEHRVTSALVEDYTHHNTAAAVLLKVQNYQVRHKLGKGLGIDVPRRASSAARKTLLGKLPRKDPKSAVQAMLTRLGCPFSDRPDACDAFVIANHRASEEGLPFVTVPADEVAA